MQKKRLLSVVMSLCMAAGAVSYSSPLMLQPITTQAAVTKTGCYSFDETTDELTLRGEVDRDIISCLSYKYSVKSVKAEEGTVLPEYCNNLFYHYSECTSIDLSKADTSNVTDMNGMFSYCSSLESLDLRGFDTSNVTDMNSMFSHCHSLKSLDLRGFDTSNVTDMQWMFSCCYSLNSLDLSEFDTSNVTDMEGVFNCCSSLNSLNLGEFDTSNVTDMDSMFNGCSSLNSLDLSELDTSNVTDMGCMFADCSELVSLNLSGFETSNVTDMQWMFLRCSKLASLDLSGFDTSNVETMYGMFSDCSSLEFLDLSRFDTSNVTDMSRMFDNCNNLITLNLKKFDTDAVTDMFDMFNGCNKLKTLTLGKFFRTISHDAKLSNATGWVNVKDSKKKISGDGTYAVIQNYCIGSYNTYTQFVDDSLTYPTNIKVTYNEKNHQVRFEWDKVEGADRYGIAVYKSGKWRIQTQDITDTVYTSPKNLTPGKTYKVAIAARVNGEWDTENAIKNAVTVTVK